MSKRKRSICAIVCMCAAIVTSRSAAFAGTAATIPTNPQIYDATGKSIGPLIAPNTALVVFKGQPLAISISYSGFFEITSVQFSFYHDVPDCGGVRYLIAGDLPARTLPYSTKFYFPKYPPKVIFAQSLETITYNKNPANPGYCSPINGGGFNINVGQVYAAPFAVLGNFVPPFSVK